MEYQKIVNLLGGPTDTVKLPKLITKKYIEVFDQSSGSYNVNKDIRFKTPQLRSALCYWEEAYIVVTGKITVINPNNDAYDKELSLKNNAPFHSCVLRIHEKLIDDCQDLDIAMSLYNLLYYSKNYQRTSGSLWNYYGDEPNSGVENNFNYSIKESKSFDYKTGLVGKLEGTNTELENIKIAVPVKYLSKFFRSLEIPLINCVLTSQITRRAQGGNAAITIPINADFSIADCKLYVPVVTLPTLYENVLYRKLKEGFFVDIYWEKYRCQITNQTTGLINYLIDPTFDNVSRLFV